MVLNGIPISDEECIGDSLATINSAFQTLSVNVESLNNASYVTNTSLSTSKMVAKAWVNFNGALNTTLTNAPNGSSLVVNSGSNQGTWNYTGAFTAGHVGTQWYLNIGGTNQTLGGKDVWIVGIRINSFISANQVTFTLLDGAATSSQTVNGNGTSTGYAFYSHGIRSLYNVSSVTKNGTGDYTVNFATPMVDANYSWAIGSSPVGINGFITQNMMSQSTNNIRFNLLYGSSIILDDAQSISTIVFGN